MAEKTVQAVCRVLKRRPRPSTSDEALKTPPLAAPRVSVLRNPPRLTAPRAFLGRESPCSPPPTGVARVCRGLQTNPCHCPFSAHARSRASACAPEDFLPFQGIGHQGEAEHGSESIGTQQRLQCRFVQRGFVVKWISCLCFPNPPVSVGVFWLNWFPPTSQRFAREVRWRGSTVPV